MKKMNGIEIGRKMTRTAEALVAALGGKRPRGGHEIVALAWGEKRVLEMRRSGELYLHNNWSKIVKCLLKAQACYIEYCKYSYYSEVEEDREFWDEEWDAAHQWLDHTIGLFCGR